MPRGHAPPRGNIAWKAILRVNRIVLCAEYSCARQSEPGRSIPFQDRLCCRLLRRAIDSTGRAERAGEPQSAREQ
jgi:hypothetical protein